MSGVVASLLQGWTEHVATLLARLVKRLKPYLYVHVIRCKALNLANLRTVQNRNATLFRRTLYTRSISIVFIAISF